jgi:hypothetical protein
VPTRNEERLETMSVYKFKAETSGYAGGMLSAPPNVAVVHRTSESRWLKYKK